MNSNIYVTTTIPYVNAAPHVGHAQEFILADTIARLYKLANHRVTFQIGTDENAFKNVASARISGVEPLQFVNENAAKFRHLADQLQVAYDTFIRTTDESHTRGVHLFWQSLKSDDLYAKSYSGLYCQGCEDFFLEKDLVNGLCPDHKTKPNTVEEENTFFRLSRYQSQLDQLISSDTIRIIPTFRKNEVLSFIRQGLQDISITRDAARSGGWGIKVPGKSDQVVYVWIDALINYLSGQGFGTNESWKNIWNSNTKKVHIIGKNVWKFHAVYWPALLLSAGLPLPNEIIVHGFLTVEGEKISKSLGNTVDPSAIADGSSTDSLRNYLLSHLSLYQDADFSLENLKHAYNTDLANNLGNLVSRLAAISRKGSLCPTTNGTNESGKSLNGIFESYDIQGLVQTQWAALSRINAEINESRPWNLLKAGDLSSVEKLLRQWTDQLHDAVLILSCFLPAAGAQILALLQTGLQKQEEPLFPRTTGKG
jgi:methionyl-tRNA synthetase